RDRNLIYIKRFRSPAPARMTRFEKAWYKRISIQSSTANIYNKSGYLYYVPDVFIIKEDL
ncbi:hypothetical protein C6576_02745, partial [Mammaliicoccus sciuri]